MNNKKQSKMESKVKNEQNNEQWLYCPECNSCMEQTDTVYSNINTSRATVGHAKEGERKGTRVDRGLSKDD